MPIIILISLISLLVILVLFNKNTIVRINQNIYSYSLDLEKRRVYYVSNPNIMENSIFHKMGIIKNNFQNLVDFLETFPLEIGQWIYDCLIHSKKEKYFQNRKQFTVNVFKKEHLLNISIGKNSDHKCILSFYTDSKFKFRSTDIKKSDFAIDNKAMVILAFKFNDRSNYEVSNHLFSFILKKGNLKKGTWKINHQKLIIIMNSNYEDDIRNNKFINKIFEKLSKNRRMKNFFAEFIGKLGLVVNSNNVGHNFSRIENVIDFLLYKSIDENEIVKSSTFQMYSDKSFLEYENNLSIFQKSISTNKILEKSYFITGTKVNNKKAYYVLPSFDKITDKILKVILCSKNNSSVLMDAFAKNLVSKKTDFAKFIDVNSFWFLRNFHLIKPSNIIYTITLEKYTNLPFLEKTIFSLTQANIYIAIKISFLSKDTITFISKSRPQFIIIDKEMTKGFTKGENIDVGLTLFSLMKPLKFELIFEFQDRVIDSHLKNKLHINSSYALDKV